MKATDVLHPINIQMRALINNGLTPEEVAQCLDLDPDAVRLSLDLEAKKSVDAEELIEKHRAGCIQALIDIGMDSDINAGIRVRALQVIVDKRGESINLPVDKLSESYKKMKQVCAGYNKVLEDTKQSITTNSR